MSRLFGLFVLFAIAAFTNASWTNENNKNKDICKSDKCQCYNDLHPSWTTVHCILEVGMGLHFYSYDLPDTLTELVVQGGQEVTFGPGAFNGITDMRRIQVSDTRMVVFQQLAAVDVRVLTLFMDIDHCNLLRFEKNSFQHLRGPMSVNISYCDTVAVEGDTFSWLLNMDISNVRDLQLRAGSFRLDPTAANVGDHGPGMTIEIRKTKISEMPKSTFGSSAAKIYLERVDVVAIRTGAFSANTYNIVQAVNSSVYYIEPDAFSENSLINYLNLDGCTIQQLASKAFRSAIAEIDICYTRFDHVESGAINTTVSKVKIMYCEFHYVSERGFELSSWNYLQMENNTFDELPPNAIVAPAAPSHHLIFKNNEIETAFPESLSFIGQAAPAEIEYLNNYFGQTCNCNISRWLALALDIRSSVEFESQSFCTVNELLARCFNVLDQNMLMKRFYIEVCTTNPKIHCEQMKSTGNTDITISNPRFPHKYKNDELTARDKKIIGIVIVTSMGCMAVAILFSLYKWCRRGFGCPSMKDIFISMRTTCLMLCGTLCACPPNVGIDPAVSISQLSVHEYSERHMLNETRPQNVVQDSTFIENRPVPQPPTIRDTKCTQTLPEELTRELLENLRERLENPENYIEARETIEHLYQLIKISDAPPQFLTSDEESASPENIYESPYQTTSHAHPNHRQMVSIGTRTPSLDKLTAPPSPYFRRPSLTHEYIEPRDLAVHLYDEILNDSRNKRPMARLPDIVRRQAFAPPNYFRVMEIVDSAGSSNVSTTSTTLSPLSGSTTDSYVSCKMLNRPLPDMPVEELDVIDFGVEERPFRLE